MKSCGDSKGKLSSSRYRGEIFFSSNGRVYFAPVIIILFPSSIEEKYKAEMIFSSLEEVRNILLAFPINSIVRVNFSTSPN